MSKIIIKNSAALSDPSDSGKTELYIDSTSKTLASIDDTGTVVIYGAVGVGAGDIVGPASSVDSQVALFDGISGKLLKDSGLTLTGSNTGDQTTVTGNSGDTNALKSATTTINVSSATAPTIGQVLTATGASAATWQAAASGSGDVVGPASAVNNNVAFFSTTTGKLIKDSGLTLSGSNTGDQTTVSGNSGTTNALLSATTTVNVSSATAPSSGQHLIATSSTAATWQTVAAAGDTLSNATTTDQSIARYNGTDNKTIEGSSVLVDDSGRIDQTSLDFGVFIGNEAGANDDLASSSGNIGIGRRALTTNTTGKWSTAVGYDALRSGAATNRAVAFGFNAGFTDNGAGNLAVGFTAGYGNQTGTHNTYLGYEAGKGFALQNHSNNIFIGYLAGKNVTTGSSNIILADSASLPTATTSSFMNLGNTIYSDLTTSFVGISETTPTAKLHIDQSSATGAVPVLKLDQADIDDSFIDFIGTSAADGTRSISSDTTEDSAKFGAIRIEINGTTKWIRIYDDES